MTKDEALKLALGAYIKAGIGNSTDFALQGKAYDLAVEALALTSTTCEVQPEQEPVAWVVYDTPNNDIAWAEIGKHLKAETPLYTAPPKIQPLTDKAIKIIHEGLCGTDDGSYYMTVARAIEAAHGIKELNT